MLLTKFEIFFEFFIFFGTVSPVFPRFPPFFPIAARGTVSLASPSNVWAKFGGFCQNPFFGRKSTFLAHFWAEKTGEFFSIFSPFSLRFSPPSAGPTRAAVNSPKIPDSGRLSGRNWSLRLKFDPHFRLLRRPRPPGKWGSNFGDFRRLPLLRSPRNSAGGPG